LRYTEGFQLFVSDYQAISWFFSMTMKIIHFDFWQLRIRT
jgi:hypothetical protein